MTTRKMATYNIKGGKGKLAFSKNALFQVVTGKKHIFSVVLSIFLVL